MSKQATKALIDEKITGNGVQAITGPILNNVLNTMVDDYGTQEEVSQLAQEVEGYSTTTETPQEVILDKSWNTNNATVPSVANLVDSEGNATSYIFCQPGDKFKIYGKDGGTKYTRLWAICDSSRSALSKADYPLNARTTPVELTIPEGGAILVVTFNSYDSTTDKAYKIITTYTPGLIDKVDDLEDDVDAIDARIDGLEIEVGKKLDGFKNIDAANLTSIPMVINTTPDGGVYKWTSNRNNNQYIATHRHARVKCSAGDKFYIKANSTYDTEYAWLTTYEQTYDTGAGLVSGTTPIIVPKGEYRFIQAPTGAEFLYLKRSLSGIDNTEYLPETILRLSKCDEETATPATLMYINYDSSTEKFVADTSFSPALRMVKVKAGEKVHFYTKYTADRNQGREIYIGFSEELPVVGGSPSIVDLAVNYAATVCYDDYYEAPFDGYFFMVSQYGTVYYTDYSFSKVLSVADAAHPLRDEKILVFGDSILSFTDSYAGKRGFVEFLSEYLGATVIRGSIGGTRLIPRGSGAFNAFDISNLIHSWVTDDWTTVDAALESEPSYAPIINNLKAIRPGEITTIIIDGGGNDLSNPSLTFGDSADADIFDENPTNDTLYGAINFIMRDLFTANPHIKIFWVNGLVGFSGSGLASRTAANWSDNRSVAVDGVTYTLKEYYAKIYEQVEKWKVPLISMADICINPVTFSQFFYDNDNTHPYKGFYRMASIVASQLVAKMFQ